MINPRAATSPQFPIEPWTVREESLDLDHIGRTESIFALSNGHLGLRGNLDEGEPFGEPGTYLSGVHELRPLPYAEAGYGFPESGQTVINVTNGKLIRLLVDDEPFDVRYGVLLHHERVLDMRAGTLRREVEWLSPAGQTIRLTTTRLVSLTQRAVAAIHYEVEAVGDAARVVVQSELIVNEPQNVPRAADPRVAASLEAPLVGVDHSEHRGEIVLVHRTTRSGLQVAAAMDHFIEAEGAVDVEHDCSTDLARTTISTVLEPGQKLCVVKWLGYGWSSVRSSAALRDQASAAIHAARATGWDGLVDEQRRYLDDYWERADVVVDGDPELQQAIRFNMFQLVQAGARAEGQAIASKGLTGSGYDGHSFWDTEAFVLPFLSATVPHAAADALWWRHSTLPQARERAAALRLKGAAFPWRTISGDECSGYWPAGTGAFHVNSAVAIAAVDHVLATGDEAFEEGIATELLVETARLWVSLGHTAADGCFHIDGVTGPDEYSAIADDNVYTNLMAARNLRAAVDAATRYRTVAERLSVTADELGEWTAAANNMFVPYDERLRVHPQANGFTAHEMWDFEGTTDDKYPLFRSFPYFDLYRKQVAKQADLVMAMQRFPDSFDEEQTARNFAYYEALTVRDSSLSSTTQSAVAAQLGHLDLAMSYLAEGALADLRDLHDNTSDGLHLAAAAGSWITITNGFGGMRFDAGWLSFRPYLPPRLDGIAFGITYRGSHLRVAMGREQTEYLVLSGDPLTITHHGEALEVAGDIVARDNPPPPSYPAPSQPSGRVPPLRSTSG